MRPFRFIHAADLHLDSPFKGLSGLPDKLRAALRDSAFAALDRLTELALEEQVDFVLFAGDIYDVKDRSLRAQLRFQQALEKLSAAGIGAFVIHGNHDPMLEGYTADLSYPERVTLFGWENVDSAIAYDRQGHPVARVSGISFGRSAVTDNLSSGYKGIRDGLFQIGLLHTNVDGDVAHGNYAPCRLSDLLDRGIDYWALGHIHTRRILHEKPWVVYSGNMQGRHVRESGPKGCYVVQVNGQGEASLVFNALDSWRWGSAAVSIEGLETEQQLKEALEDAIFAARDQSEGRGTMLRIELTGRGTMHGSLRRAGAISELTAALREVADDVWVENVIDRTGAQVDPDALLEQPGFLGELLRFSRELAASSGQLQDFMNEALKSLEAQPVLFSLLEECLDDEKAAWLQEAEELAIDLLMIGAESDNG